MTDTLHYEHSLRYAGRMSEEFKINHADALNAPGSPTYRTFDEVVISVKDNIKEQLHTKGGKGTDGARFNQFLDGYVQALHDFEIIEDRNLDGDAALVICSDALNKWRELNDR